MDWKTIHNKTTWVSDIYINDKIKLVISNINPFFNTIEQIKEEHYKEKNELYNLFNKNQIVCSFAKEFTM